MEVCALNTIHLPLSFSEVPPSSSPCLSHISQPQSPLSYERGSLGLGNQCSPAGSGCSTIWEGDQEGLSAHTEPPSPTTSRAAGQPPPVSSEEKHRRSAPFPTQLCTDWPPSHTDVLEICSHRREGEEKGGFKELLLLL